VPGDKGLHARLGTAIREHRRRQGLSQEALANKADLSTRYLSDLEAGRKSASIRTLKRLADALSTKIYVILRDAEGR